MLKGLSSFALRVLPLLLLSAPAWASNDTLYINSQGGDSVGDGLQATYTDSDGGFAATENLSNGYLNGVTVKFNASAPNASWTLTFDAPVGATLATGNYDGTNNTASLTPLQPSMILNYCEFGGLGRFIIRQFTTDGLGNVTSFAADFRQVCGGKGSLTGAIRFNSTLPVAVDQPTSDAGTHQLVQPGSTVQLDGSLSLPGNGSITAYSWTQLSGPSITFSDPTLVSPTFTAPSVSLGGADVVLRLEVDNSLALSDLSTVTIHVANPADPLTLFTATGDVGSVIPQGGTVTLNDFQALFTTGKLSFFGDGVSVNVAGLSSSWSLSFAAPTGDTLQVGTYDDAQRYPFQTTNMPGLGFGNCNTSAGRFSILDLQENGGGQVTSFAADFEQHCDGQLPKAIGMIRVNSTVPLDAPVADVMPVQTMQQGETVTLQAADWATGTDGDDIATYQWTQISGTPVALSDAAAATPTFTAPNESAGGEDLVFELTVTNSLGISSSTQVTVHIADPSDLMNLIHVETTPGGNVALPYSVTVTAAQKPFTVSYGSVLNSGFGAGIHANNFDLTNPWNIGLTGPTASAPPTSGTYDIPANLPSFGNVSVASPAKFGCTGNTTARFAILAIQVGANNAINSVAADFDEFCSNSAATLHGTLRYNSSVPLDTPVSDPGVKQNVAEGAAVTLSGAASYAGGDDESVVSYQWTQTSGPSVTLSDASAASTGFSAPTVDVGGVDLVFQLTVINSNGLSNSSDVTVHVANPADPITVMELTSAAGDPVGQGQAVSLNLLNAVFNVSNAPNLFHVINQAAQVVATTSISQVGSTAWNLQFTAALGQPLQVGAYDGAVPYSNSQNAGQPEFTASYSAPFSGSRGCTFQTDSSGFFDVLDVQRDSNNNITSLALDFVQQCSGASGALHGKFRYNSAVPLDQPFADAGHAQTVQVGQPVTLGGTGSVAGADGSTITSVQWVQTGGPTVSLSDPTSADPTFNAPTVTTGTDLTFTVTITNSDGLSSTSTVTIHVDAPTDPKTIMYLQGSADDVATQGQTVALTPPNALFSATPSTGFSTTSGHVITLAADQGDVGFEDLNWRVILQAPNNDALQNGQMFPLAQELSTEPSTPDAGIQVDGVGNCILSSGQFRIRDLQYAQDGSIASFAADVVQYCQEGPNATRLNGWVRYNSTVPLGTPIAIAGSAQTTFTGFTTMLDGSQSVGGPGISIASYQWTQLLASGDPTVALTGATTATPSFVAPAVPLGGKTLTFQLMVTNNMGLTDTQTVAVHVGSQNDAKWLLFYASTAGDPVGGGNQGLILDTENGSVGAEFSLDAVGAEVFGDTPAILGSWELDFQSAAIDLAPGVYISNGVDAFPAMLVKSGATCNSPTGIFIVRDVQRTSRGGIDGAGIDFVQHCAGASGVLQGALRVNSTSPAKINRPTAYAGPSQVVTSAGLVTLDGTSSFIGWSGQVSYQWTRISGPWVQLLNSATSIASFELPASYIRMGGTKFVFELTVTNSAGLSSSALVTVTATLPLTSLLSFQSDPGDAIGHGRTASYAVADAALPVQTRKDNNSLQAKMTSNGGWLLDFAAPDKQPLAVGSYPNATLYKMIGTRTPGLSVSAKGHECRTVGGDFTVLDIQYVGATLSSLAVDFDQYCDGSSAGLHGKLRYHSSIP
jgi:K319-like protein